MGKLKPLVRKDSYFANRELTPLVIGNGYTTDWGANGVPIPWSWKTVTGSLIHITDALASPVNALSVNIDPVQDLHGFDNPWPAGGGKNLLPPGLSAAVTGSATATPTQSGGYVISATANAGWLWARINTIPAGPLAGKRIVFSFNIEIDHTQNPQTIFSLRQEDGTVIISKTATYNQARNLYIDVPGDVASGSYLAMTLYVTTSTSAEVGWKTTYTDLQMEVVDSSATSPTNYAPYSNICPISGHTSATVTRTGKNFASISSETEYSEQNVSANYTENITTINANSKYGRMGWLFKVVPNEQYTISFKGYGSANYRNIYISCREDAGKFANPNDQWGTGNFSINFEIGTTEAEYTRRFVALGEYVFFGCYVTSTGTSGDVVISDLQLEMGDGATAYEPYAGTTIPITFPTPPGTVYGGTLDVTTGVLTVERANIASYAGETLPGEWISDRDVYSPGATPTTGAQVVYKLATPLSYQLTAQEVTTLLGVNNIWADTGDTTVTYMAHA